MQDEYMTFTADQSQHTGNSLCKTPRCTSLATRLVLASVFAIRNLVENKADMRYAEAHVQGLQQHKGRHVGIMTQGLVEDFIGPYHLTKQHYRAMGLEPVALAAAHFGSATAA